MRQFRDHLVDIGLVLAAIPAALLPRRYWPGIRSLAVERYALVSGLATMLAGVWIGAMGFFAYSERVGAIAGKMTFDVAQAQLEGRLPMEQSVNIGPLAVSMLSPFAFAFFTPLGLTCLYAVLSGFLRAAAVVIGEPCGDPLLTGLDSFSRRMAGGMIDRRRRKRRLSAEGRDVPDRLYAAEALGVAGADLVVIASRQKPGWEPGTTIVTADTWYTLGVPFDLETPEGLRTVYPLTEQKVAHVLRKGAPYELPRLSTGRPRVSTVKPR